MREYFKKFVDWWFHTSPKIQATAIVAISVAIVCGLALVSLPVIFILSLFPKWAQCLILGVLSLGILWGYFYQIFKRF